MVHPSRAQHTTDDTAEPGPFTIFMRLYWRGQVALDGSWQAPKPVKVS
jgi:hypothetical protein